MKREKTIPTLIGLIILSVSLAFGLFLTSGPVNFFSKASDDCTPAEVKVSNVSHYSLTISFSTPSLCFSNLMFNNKTVPDLITRSSRTHYFEITNLKENTDYGYYVISGGKAYKNSAYKAKTAKKPSSATPNSRLAWGKVYFADSNPATDSIVYLSIPDAAPISALVTANGYWYISLATSFNKQLNNWFSPVDNIMEGIEVLAPDLSKTSVAGNTSRNNPVPDIIIGENSDTPPPTSKPLGGTFDSATQSLASKSLTIESPKEAETINTRRPDIFGTSASQAIIVFNVGEIKDSVQAKIDGTWHWYPQTDLSVGINKLSATSNSEKIERNFFISADASQLAYTASSSAQITSILPTPTPTPSVIATSTPILTLTPTISRTVTVRSAKTSTGSGVPVTGNTLPTVICLLTAFGLISTSFILTKKDNNQV
jgi:hypothetical protein